MHKLVTILLLLSATPAYPCATFALPDNRMPDFKKAQPQTIPNTIIAKSYEWHDESGLVFINKRGIKKQSLVLLPSDKPATWQSRFASLTFNQYGREFPVGGINEQGIVIEASILNLTQYPKPNNLPTVNELNFVQYLLDQAKSTDHAIELAKKVRITPIYAKLHYFVCSPEGSCGVIEFLDGKLITSSGAFIESPIALTNSPFKKCYNAWAERNMNITAIKYYRFINLYKLIINAIKSKNNNITTAWNILKWLTSNSFSPMQWQIVYEAGEKQVHFRTREHKSIKTVNLNNFELDCNKPALITSLISDATGDISKSFTPYTQKANYILVANSLRLLDKNISQEKISLIANYPQQFKCMLNKND
ncbi:MAG: hypothetical protein JW841_17285 [Deltaproteobacteria bacterium]|nr:hypothetical protein [Deltaproteobacteria bacterium]